MGQIFHACAYDIDTKECCVIDADKFHANCFSFSGTTVSMHFLLRQKPYNIMWGGDYVVTDKYLSKVESNDILLGLSTYLNYEDFRMNDENLEEKEYLEKVKFIDENNKLWQRIDVWDKALEYFNYKKTKSVKYSGYLLNHTKKLFVDLADYFSQSELYGGDWIEMSMDLLPILTETGDGAQMAFSDGIFADTTEQLAGKWCGDLLQIVDELPKDYLLINCCFADVSGKARYCHKEFGINENGLLLKDNNSNLFEAVKLNFYGERGATMNMKVELTEDKVRCISVPKE